MKLEIYNDTETEMAPIRLGLKKGHNGIDVVVMQADGHVHPGGHLLRFTNMGKISLHSGIDIDLGFELTSSGRIKAQ